MTLSFLVEFGWELEFTVLRYAGIVFTVGTRFGEIDDD